MKIYNSPLKGILVSLIVSLKSVHTDELHKTMYLTLTIVLTGSYVLWQGA